MTSLDTAVTLSAVADRHAKLVDDRALHRQVLLVLRDDAAPTQPPATVRTRRRQRHVIPHVDARRPPPMRLRAVRRPRLATRPLGMLLRQAARKRRRLAARLPPCRVELVFQPLVLATQPVPFDLRPPHLVAQPLIVALQFVDDLLRVRRRRVLGAPRHVSVMPDSRAQYKRKTRISGPLTR